MLPRFLAPVLGVVALIAGAIFFSVLFFVGAVLVLAIFGHLWWKTRQLRRQPGGWPPRPPGGDVIEGEYTVEQHREEDILIRGTGEKEPPGEDRTYP